MGYFNRIRVDKIPPYSAVKMERCLRAVAEKANICLVNCFYVKTDEPNIKYRLFAYGSAVKSGRSRSCFVDIRLGRNLDVKVDYI